MLYCSTNRLFALLLPLVGALALALGCSGPPTVTRIPASWPSPSLESRALEPRDPALAQVPPLPHTRALVRSYVHVARGSAKKNLANCNGKVHYYILHSVQYSEA